MNGSDPLNRTTVQISRQLHSGQKDSTDRYQTIRFWTMDIRHTDSVKTVGQTFTRKTDARQKDAHTQKYARQIDAGQTDAFGFYTYISQVSRAVIKFLRNF
jgi:hypothetical protein